MEIETKFERVIDYEQAGKDVIGTMISAHTEDPRYEETEPLNWVEGAEGIYVQTPETVNFIWMRYRKEAPEYSENTMTIQFKFLSTCNKSICVSIISGCRY